MYIRYLSLIDNPPAGFAVGDFDRRELLSGIVVLLAESRESAFALLPDFPAKVRGVVITYGAEAIERVGPLLWHVGQPRETPLRLKDGCIHALCEIATEITALKENKQFFRTLAEKSPDVIVRYDRNNRRVYVNPAFERVNGISASAAINKTPLELPFRLGSHAAFFTDRLMAAMDSGNTVTFELTLNDVESAPRILVRLIPMFDKDNNVISTLGIISDISELMEKERRLEESLETVRRLMARRDRAREEERQRIALGIHDDLGQALIAQRLEVDALKMQFGKDNEDLAAQCDRMTGIVDRTIQTVRNLVTHLRLPALETGIVTALEWLASGFQESMTIPCRLHIQPPDLQLDDAQSIAVFRIVQESLTNVMRHARARQVDIHVEAGEDRCGLSIRDDGVGFDVDRANRNSFGLVGIRERAQTVGGEARITSVCGLGTTIEVSIPRRRKHKRAKRTAP